MKARPLISMLLALMLFVSGADEIASAAQTTHAGQSYHAERFDVVLSPQPGGGLLVTETVIFRFEGEPFTFVFRDISLVETDGIEFVSAGMDGVQLPQGSAPGQVELLPGDPFKITWHFAPTFNSTHSFELTYRARGAIRRDQADTLIWRAVPEEHEYTILTSRISLRAPQAAALLEAPTLQGAPAQVEWDTSQAVLTTGEIEPNKSLVVTARFPSGSLAQTMPTWQARQEQRSTQLRGALPWSAAAGSLVLLVGLAVLIAALQRGRREENPVPELDAARPVSPPSAAPPAAAARLAGGALPFMAALLDLARRGHLVISQKKSGWLRGNTFVVSKAESRDLLRPHEVILLESLFPGGLLQTEQSISEAYTRLAQHSQAFNAALDDELREGGWLDEARHRLRRRLLGAGTMGLLLGLALFVAGALLAVTAAAAPALLAAGVGAGLALAGLAALIAGASYSPWTARGEQEGRAWKGFSAYLRDVTRGREAVTRSDLFERYLAYAAGLGLGSAWAHFFQKQGAGIVPAWFQSLQTSGDANFGSFVAFMSAADSAAASGSDGGASAGGGASGGGASGAG